MRLIKLLLATLFLFTAGVTAHASEMSLPNPNGLTANQIDYWLVAPLGITDDEGRLLVWEGTIDGVISGDMKWWFVLPPPVLPVAHNGGETRFYQARWEIFQDGELILAGESAGKTVFPLGEDGMWDGHGVVTEARGLFSPLKGRKIYESGPVILVLEPAPTFEGTGIFSIY